MADKFKRKSLSSRPPQGKDKSNPGSFNKVQNSLYDDFAQAYGNEFALINILQLAWPVHKVKLDITVSCEPEDVLKDIHLILLQLIQNKINTYESISKFLGLESSDFLLDELIELRKNYLLEYYDDCFHLKPLGNDFIKAKSFIPVIEKKIFSTCIDGITNTVVRDYEIYKADDSFQKIDPEFKNINYTFVESIWSTICERFKSENKGQEIVELSNGRQSVFSQIIYEPRYLMVFRGKQGEQENRIKFKLLDRKRIENTEGSKVIEEIVLKSPDTFLLNLEGFEYSFPHITKHPLEEKINAVSGFQHINFQEVDDYLRYALQNGKVVYIEVPRILRKAKNFINDFESFLKKTDTKLYLIYGVSDDYQHDIDTVTRLKTLRRLYPNFIFIDLPEKAYNTNLKVSGVHKRIIIKDNDFYIETTYNFFTLDLERKQKISAETATIFNRDVNEYFDNQKKLYKIN